MWFFIYLIALALGKRKLFTGKNAEFVSSILNSHVMLQLNTIPINSNFACFATV